MCQQGLDRGVLEVRVLRRDRERRRTVGVDVAGRVVASERLAKRPLRELGQQTGLVQPRLTNRDALNVLWHPARR
jgi:hypothetical protein